MSEPVIRRMKGMWEGLLSPLDDNIMVVHEDDLQNVVEIMVESRIDTQKFFGNLCAFLNSGKSSNVEVPKGWTVPPPTTPSVKHFNWTPSLYTPGPSGPLWMIAGFPDVLHWLKQKLLSAPDPQDAEEICARVFGPSSDNNQQPETNNDGTLRARCYRNLIANYQRETGKTLETAVDGEAENNPYLGQSVLDLLGEDSNFTLVASITTRYYMELKRTYGGRFRDETSLLAMAGILDAKYHIFVTKKIDPSQIIQLACVTEGMEDRLLEFIIGFEAIVLWPDNPELTPAEVRSACEEQADAIRGSIRRTMDSYTGEPRIANDVRFLMQSPQFADVRRAAGVTE